ncbi:MAG: multidrug efflux protein [Coxiellaceae bacterium]|nr:multidrug efflux protein [Coxiellaceae bacterium]
MGNFTDFFIRRPVFASVVSLLFLLVGLQAIFTMQVREYPEMENTVITVTTAYPGASADTVQGFVTTPLEQAIASADGLDYFTSTSVDGTSTITVYVQLNYDPNAAFTSVLSEVQQVENTLPTGAQLPIITKSTGAAVSLMYIGFSSSEMSAGQITAYLTDVVQPQIQTVNGVSSATIMGSNTYAMRIWLNRDRMNALGVTPADISSALQANNYQSSGGLVKGKYVEMNISADTSLTDQAQFESLVIKTGSSGQLVYLRDVARVELGSTAYNKSVYFDNQPSVVIAVNGTSTANPLTVIKDVKTLIPEMQALYPPSLSSNVVYDASLYIQDSINEVIRTIVEAGLIVTFVIFLFLGSLRTVCIPVITLPLSLVGVFVVMTALGYSINLLTLLALVLAIGLVVDDAIVVLENTYRLIEEGETPFNAALVGAREISGPVIAMTITLVAVYAPIGLMTGVTGALFTEFAFTLAGAVLVSGVIALTLTPMMCSKMLNASIGEQVLVKFIDQKFSSLKQVYQKALKGVLSHRPAFLFLGFVVFVSNLFLFVLTPSELSPIEDQGVVLLMGTAPTSANLNYLERYTSTFRSYYTQFPAFAHGFVVNGSSSDNTAMSFMLLKPWSERSETQQTVYRDLASKIRNVQGMQVFPVQLSSLPTSTGTFPIEFVIKSLGSYEDLYEVSEEFLNKAMASGKFLFLQNSLDYNKPNYAMNIDYKKAGQLGISMQDIGAVLSPSLSENFINYFSMYNRSYEVIPQLDAPFRKAPADLDTLYINNSAGDLLPLSTIFSYDQTTVPNELDRFQQINSATIQGVSLPNLVSVGQAATYLQDLASEVLPSSYSYSYAGDLRSYVEEGNALLYTFIFALIIIYLVLSAQFESFRDPLVILTSVPMATCGALIPLCMGFSTINIYSEVGLITLIGLISKHGILMVEFARQLREEKGYDLRQAIEEAAAIRLRPVLMTTAAMVLGVFPLLIATGAGAVSRFDIGLTIASGMCFGTVFTLFIVPTVYTLTTRQILAFLFGAIATCAILVTFL